MAERYNVRNVAQKEVYDSYMGILRISPIEVNGKDMDDVTSILNTLVDIDGSIDKDGTREKNSIITVRLSDSDGNALPITFIPKAFNQLVLVRDGGADTYQTKAVINIATNVDRFLFASENLVCRSTLSIKIDPTRNSDKVSLLQIATGGKDNNSNVSAKTILCYPIEAPNDEDYFNNKNKLGVITGTTSNGYLFDPLISNKPRHEQVKENLLKQSRSWYELNFPIDDSDNTSPHRVKVAGRFINRYNEKGLEVPVLHTRDYVLGHYDGHSWTKSSKESDDFQQIWCGDTKLNEISDFSHITKLSWIRFDDLVWDALDEVLKGTVRHTKGRYSDLGSSKTGDSDIRQTLFGNTADEEFKYSKLNRTAPILGAGVEQGIIMYHAMPFHRYWFHRCRQATQNLKRKALLLGDVDWNYGTTEGSKENNEAYRLQKACKVDGSITPCSMATLSPTHSLSKDYLLCNGLEVSFENFPNISPTNENLFMTKNGKPVTVDTTTGKYKFRSNHNPLSKSFDTEYTRDTYNKNNVYNALQQTNIESFAKIDGKDINYLVKDRIYLPNLFSLSEKAPRFIRGLDWLADDGCVGDITKYSSIDTKTYDENGKEIEKIYYPSKKWLEGDTLANPVKDIFGAYGFAFQRNFDKVKLHFYNYDHLVETKRHYHLLFSNYQGGQGDKQDLSYCYYYDYDANNGGSTHKKWTTMNTINRNFLFNETTYPDAWLKPEDKAWEKTKWITLKSEEWLRYCFYKNSIQTFYNFTPVPNCGLFLFDGDIYNNPSLDDYNIIVKIPRDCLRDINGKTITDKQAIKDYLGMKEYNGTLINNLSDEDVKNIIDTNFPITYTFTRADQDLGGKIIYNRLENLLGKETLNEVAKIIKKDRAYLNKWFCIKIPLMGGYISIFLWPGGSLYTNFSWNEFSKMKNYSELTTYVGAFSAFNDKNIMTLIEMNEEHQKNLDLLLTGLNAQTLINGDPKIYLGSIQKYENDNWNNFTYHDGKNNTHDFSAANIGLKPPMSIDTWNTLENDEKYDFLEEHANAKRRRKMLMMKINESEARIPISYVGKAQFSTSYYFTYERKRSWWSSTMGGDEWDTETEHFKMTNVGNYEISSYKPHADVTPKWRCLSSLGYTDPQYLAYGNIADEEDPLIRDTYWNTHNVTDFFKQDIVKESYTTYGGKKITLDIQSPYPSHIKLLPLIRL